MNNSWIFAIIFIFLSPQVFIAQVQPQSGNVPITFYGKVLDQESNAVPRAKVNIAVSIVDIASWGGELKQAALETDQNGTFTVTGFIANSLNISSIKKDGYELSKKAVRSYRYAISDHFHPEPDHPVIFRMWKSAGKEQLVGSAWHGKIAGDGATNRFELNTGKANPNGNLQIICARVPAKSALHGHGHFDYTVEIGVVGGAIQPTDDEFTYRAPENRYVPAFSIERKADNVQWQPNFNQEFYIKTADGRYGRLHVDWEAWRPPPNHLEWDCSINPSGSRNLER
jgi:hypothetical protein